MSRKLKMPKRKYTKKSDYWNNVNTSDRQIRLIYNKNKSLINDTDPGMDKTGMNAYELFEVQVRQKAKDGKSIPAAAKEVLNARQYTADPKKGQAIWYHDRLIEDLTPGEKAVIYKQKLSLSFNRMRYLENKEAKIILKDKDKNEVEFTRKARYISGISTIDLYYSQGYKQKVILINGVLATGKRKWTM